MVKVDVRRDYYADLGVGPGADTDEIKRQFRKLALKYHPDRNPGREAEFITKFQAIQAAHEILTDSQQRAKYDLERLRAGYGKLYGPPSGNNSRRTNTPAYPAGNANKPATPKPPPSRPNSYQAPPSTGAQKYANYAKAAPQQHHDRMYEQQARADAFPGFQGMRTSGWANLDTKSGRPKVVPTRNPTTNNTPPNSSRGKTAFEYVNSRQHPDAFGRASTVKKKHGFAPGTPGGDEPMARNNSSYASVPRADRSSAFFDSAPAPTAKVKRTPTSSRPETPVDDVAPEFEQRASHRYATTGGEKTYLSGIAGIARAYSMRDSSASSKGGRSRTNPPSPRSPAQSRHRSASPGIRRQHKAYSSSPTSSSSEDDSNESDSDHMPRRKAVPKSRLKPGHKFHFQGPGAGEETFHRNYFMDHPPLRSHRRHHSLFDENRSRSYHEYQDQSTDSEYPQGNDSDGASFAFRTQQAARATGHTAQENARLSQPSQPSVQTNIEDGLAAAQHGSKSRSHDNLNKRFSASDWGDAFKPDLFAPSQSNGHRRSRSKTSPRRGRPATRNESQSPANVDYPNKDAAKQATSSWNQSQFSADAWSQHFQSRNSIFEPPRPQQQQGNASTAPGRSIPATARQTKQPAVSTEAEEDERTVPQQSSKPESVPIPDAMEIDDEPSSLSTKAQTNGIRRPSKTPLETESNNKASGNVGNINGSGKTSEWMSSLFNMKTLDDVAPFTSSNNGGINDLNDIYTTLPFESRPNDPNSSRRMSPQNRSVNLPLPPKRPVRPAVIPNNNDPRNMVLPKQSWENYQRQMSAYIIEWNKFQRQMLQLLAVRQLGFETGLAPRWIDASGDSLRLNTRSSEDDESTVAHAGTGESDTENDPDILMPHQPHGGYKAYFNAVDDYTRVLEHWTVAWERHRECIIQLGEIRQFIRGHRNLM